MAPESNPGEEWRDVVGYEGLYLVSNQGRVWSIQRFKVKGRILRQTPRHNGHPQVGLYAGGSQTKRSVPHLVIEAFVGPRPDGMECCHNDGDPTNNRPENLRWDSHAANMADAVQHGSFSGRSGEQNSSAKLTEKDVREIRDRRAKGESYRKIALSYSVGRTQVGAICRGESWAETV